MPNASICSIATTTSLEHRTSLVQLGGSAGTKQQPQRPVLKQAREIFEGLKAVPALAETDAPLAQATALSGETGSVVRNDAYVRYRKIQPRITDWRT